MPRIYRRMIITMQRACLGYYHTGPLILCHAWKRRMVGQQRDFALLFRTSQRYARGTQLLT